jgi:hypothetical protein
MKKYTLAVWEEKASRFLETYFKDLYRKDARLTSVNPPVETLTHVKGYVTTSAGYWENVQVTLDNIQLVEDKLMIQCSMDGEYVKLETPYITEDAFDRPFSLEKDYNSEMNSLCLEIINAFDKFLKTNPCSKTH